MLDLPVGSCIALSSDIIYIIPRRCCFYVCRSHLHLTMPHQASTIPQREKACLRQVDLLVKPLLQNICLQCKDVSLFKPPSD